MHKLRALRASFEESLQQLEGVTSSLSQGRPPAGLTAERLRALQEQFVQVREALIDEAKLHDVVIPEELGTLESLEVLGREIEARRRRELHTQIGDVLSRTTSLSHREEVVFQSLQQIREEAFRLSGEDAPLEELERLVEGRHPFVSLLKLVEDNGEMSNDEALELSRQVEKTFGRALAVAVLRHRLIMGPQTSFSGQSLPSLLTQSPEPLSPSGIYEEALEHERRALANLAPPSQKSTGLDTQEEEPTPSGTNGSFHSAPALASSPEPVAPPSPFASAKRPVDTWDELPSPSASSEYRSVTLYAESPSAQGLESSSGPRPPDSAGDELPPPPFMLASSAPDTSIERPPATPPPSPSASLMTPTDEVPVIRDEDLDGEEPTTEDGGFQPLHIPNEIGQIEVPSIEMMAVAAMNAVLVPGMSQDALDASHNPPEEPPRPPTSPRKMPTPTFLTPLPLSVNMAPGGVIQPSRQHEMVVAAQRAAQESQARSHLSGSLEDLAALPSTSSQGLPSSAMLAAQSAPSLTGLSSPSLGGALPLESYDAMLIRQTDPKDLSRASPLTVWQDNELQRREHGVAVMFGSSALGLEDLADFIELSVGSEQLYVIDQVYAPHRFLRQIRQIAGRRDGSMTFVLVTHQTPWDSSWVRGALELVSQMKAASRPLRITFVADPPSTWSMIPSIQPLQQDGAMMLSLQPWHDSALLKWLQQLDFPFDHKIRRSIRRVTGNWSFALKFFYRQMIQGPNQWARHLGSLKQVLESRELAQKALRIMGLTHKTTLSILHKLTIEEPATQESMERAFAHAPPRLITRALLWAERLSLAQYENYFWTTNPLVARLLKALR